MAILGINAKILEAEPHHVGEQEVAEVEAIERPHDCNERLNNLAFPAANGESTNRCASHDWTTREIVTRMSHAAAVPAMPQHRVSATR